MEKPLATSISGNIKMHAQVRTIAPEYTVTQVWKFFGVQDWAKTQHMTGKCAQRPDSQLGDKGTLDAQPNSTQSWQTDFADPSTSLECPWAWHIIHTPL